MFSKNGEQKPREVLCILTAEEREAIGQANNVIALRKVELELMSRGAASIQAAIQKKYNLPNEFNLDVATGEVTKVDQ